MARIIIKDIPQDQKISKQELKAVYGGPTAVEYAVMLAKSVKDDGRTSLPTQDAVGFGAPLTGPSGW